MSNLCPSLSNESSRGAGNLSNVSSFGNNPRADGAAGIENDHEMDYLAMKYYIQNVVIPIVLILGIGGNIMNLIILTRSRLCNHLDTVEKSATAGLFSLSLSDLMFCFVMLPLPLFEKYSTASSTTNLEVLALYYKIYHVPLINIFVASSTWIIVLISAERCFAISFPIQSRFVIQISRTITTHVIVFVIAVAVHIPMFLLYNVKSCNCGPGCKWHWIEPTPLFWNKHFELTYPICLFVLITAVPVTVMSTCNIRLVKELRESQKSFNSERRSINTTKITQISVIMIVLFIFLVCPSNIVHLLQVISLKGSLYHYYVYKMAIQITNLCQAIKFSINFVLYSAVSRNFRKALFSTCHEKTQPATFTAVSDMSTHTNGRYQLVEISVNVVESKGV